MPYSTRIWPIGVAAPTPMRPPVCHRPRGTAGPPVATWPENRRDPRRERPEERPLHQQLQRQLAITPQLPDVEPREAVHAPSGKVRCTGRSRPQP